jgi:endonuclease YncB( thermonuclease family)
VSINYIVKPIVCLILFLNISVNLAQAYKHTAPQLDFSKDPCGNPLMVSTAYMSVSGKVVEVLDGDTFISVLEGGRRVQVDLMGMRAPSRKSELGKASRKHLTNIILNKLVTIHSSSYEKLEHKHVIGLVSVEGQEGLSGVNLEQLKRGLARYKESGPELDWWQKCHYQRAEKEAQTEHRGIWQRSARQ